MSASVLLPTWLSVYLGDAFYNKYCDAEPHIMISKFFKKLCLLTLTWSSFTHHTQGSLLSVFCQPLCLSICLCALCPLAWISVSESRCLSVPCYIYPQHLYVLLVSYLIGRQVGCRSVISTPWSASRLVGTWVTPWTECFDHLQVKLKLCVKDVNGADPTVTSGQVIPSWGSVLTSHS